MGNGPVVNTDRVKAKMKERGITLPILASRLRKSPSWTRNVVNGYVPEDWETVLGAIGGLLGLTIEEIVIGDLPERRTA